MVGDGGWLDVQAAARWAAVSESTIRRELRSGRLRGYRVGGRKCWRLRPQDVDAWLTSGGHQPGPDGKQTSQWRTTS